MFSSTGRWTSKIFGKLRRFRSETTIFADFFVVILFTLLDLGNRFEGYVQSRLQLLFHNNYFKLVLTIIHYFWCPVLFRKCIRIYGAGIISFQVLTSFKVKIQLSSFFFRIDDPSLFYLDNYSIKLICSFLFYYLQPTLALSLLLRIAYTFWLADFINASLYLYKVRIPFPLHNVFTVNKHILKITEHFPYSSASI